MKRTLIGGLPTQKGNTCEIRGWVSHIRKLAKMSFVTIRDFSGTVQVFVDAQYLEGIEDIKPESVIALTAQVNERPAKQIKKEEGALGGIELYYQSHTILSLAQTPPFEISKDTSHVDDELRLEYRYLDLRSERMTKNIRTRQAVFQEIRSFMQQERSVEIETPYLTKGTPEGAREYIVPARNFPGKFYVLPQSPQQFKQLLMVAGFERYFQIVRCFRDEDQRKDRQPEFTQVDIEMSFVDQDDVLDVAERMLVQIVKKIFPEKHITQVPFPRISYDEALKKYGTDKPDIRKNPKDPNELGFSIIVDFPMFERSESEKKLVSTHHLFTAPQSQDEQLLDRTPEKARAQQYDIALNGFEIAGGSIRIHDVTLQQKVFSILGLSDKDVQRRFGHMLKAFSYGVPPHGGIAFGADRLVAVLCGEEQIREVIPFPKTADARDPLMDAPTELSEERLQEAHISVLKKE